MMIATATTTTMCCWWNRTRFCGQSYKLGITINADATVPLNDEYLTVAGYGVTVEGVSSTQSGILREADVQYMTNDECDRSAGLYSGEYVM